MPLQSGLGRTTQLGSSRGRRWANFTVDRNGGEGWLAHPSIVVVMGDYVAGDPGHGDTVTDDASRDRARELRSRRVRATTRTAAVPRERPRSRSIGSPW